MLPLPLQWTAYFFLLIAYYFSSIAGIFIRLEKVRSSKKTRIVLLNGFFSRTIPLFLLKRRLEQEGYAVHVPYLGFHAGTIEGLSAKLAAYAKKHKLQDIIFIGHSMGGLIGLHCHQQHGLRIKTLITLGTPYQGTWLALLPSFLPSARQMLPGSAFLRRLQQGKKPKHAHSIASRHDEQVPYNATFMPGMTHKESAAIGHIMLLYSKETFGKVKEALAETEKH